MNRKIWDLFFIVGGAEVLKNIKTYKVIGTQCMCGMKNLLTFPHFPAYSIKRKADFVSNGELIKDLNYYFLIDCIGYIRLF